MDFLWQKKTGNIKTAYCKKNVVYNGHNCSETSKTELN